MSGIMTWGDLLNSGELEGYDESYINPIDAETAAEFPCENCGGQCIGRGRQGVHGYRSFSECQNCRRVIEF